jgi:hypothetical protein
VKESRVSVATSVDDPTVAVICPVPNPHSEGSVPEGQPKATVVLDASCCKRSACAMQMEVLVTSSAYRCDERANKGLRVGIREENADDGRRLGASHPGKDQRNGCSFLHERHISTWRLLTVVLCPTNANLRVGRVRGNIWMVALSAKALEWRKTIHSERLALVMARSISE